MEKLILFRKATCRKEIKVGCKVPNEVLVYLDSGSMSMNLGSWYFNELFKNKLSKFQSEPYEFSEICRNENELKAFYAAIKENCLDKGYNVEFID